MTGSGVPVEILAGMGLGAEPVERGQRIDAITLADGGRALARVPFDGLDSRYSFALGTPQNVTESLLIARPEKHDPKITRGVRIATVTQHGHECHVAGRRIDTDRFLPAGGDRDRPALLRPVVLMSSCMGVILTGIHVTYTSNVLCISQNVWLLQHIDN